MSSSHLYIYTSIHFLARVSSESSELELCCIFHFSCCGFPLLERGLLGVGEGDNGGRGDTRNGEECLGDGFAVASDDVMIISSQCH